MAEVRAKKALGQHFLTDKGIARRIAEALSGGGAALEVGCGMGVLTQFLLGRDDLDVYKRQLKPPVQGSPRPSVRDDRREVW